MLNLRADSPDLHIPMAVRRSSLSPSSGRSTIAALRERCERLERLLRHALASRSRVIHERDSAVERIRAVGDDFVTAFEAVDARTDAAIAAAELRGLLGHDLDITTTLAIATEHLIAGFRPANAALWLCNTRGEHALGAYGAAEIPRPRAEATLGLIAREVCPRLSTAPVAILVDDATELLSVPPPGGGILPGQSAIVAPIVFRGDRFGALMLLQPSEQPWPPNAVETVGALAGVVGEHLDRIMRIAVRRTENVPGLPGACSDGD